MKRFRVVPVLAALLLALGVIWPAPASALTSTGDAGWYWQSPLPLGWSGSCVDWGDNQNAWIGSREGVVLHSADAGLSWAAQWPGFGQIEAISFADAQNGWAISSDYDSGSSGDVGVLIHTGDGGATWNRVTLPVEHAVLVAVDFADALHGHAVGYVFSEGASDARLIVSTSDGGATWKVRQTGGTQLGYESPRFTAVVAFDALHAWVAGDGGRVRVTSDGGLSWAARNLPTPYRVDQLVAFDAQHAAVHSGYYFYSTSDGGVTWRQMDVPQLGSWVWLAIDQGRLLVTWTDYWDPKWGVGTILASDDWGATFSRTYAGDDFLAYYQAFSSEGTGMAVGNSLWRRPAGGDWQRITTGPGYALSDVDFTDTSHGWAVGLDSPYSWGQFIDSSDQGRILHTDDGVTWTEQQLPDGPGLTSVIFIDQDTGWAGGAAGRVVHTTDGGARWADQDTGFEGTVEDVTFVDALHGWAACSGTQIDGLFTDETGAVLKTVDGGVTWTVTKMPFGVELKSVWFVSALDGWAAGSWTPYSQSTYLLHSVDGGTTWQRVDMPHVGPLSYVTFTDAQHGWVLAGSYDLEGYSVLRTSDGGATWAVADPPYPQALSSIRMTDAQHGWASGNGMFQTSDGGATWQQVAKVGGAFDVVDATHIWAVGGGRIVSTVDTAADTASPATVDDVDRQIHNRDVTVHLRAIDIGGSSVARSEYRIDGEQTWRQGTEYTFSAPLSHLGDGVHWLSYRSVDSMGNVERTHQRPVTIDTTGPTTRAWAIGRYVSRGARVRFPYIVNDALSHSATATLVILRQYGPAYGQVRVVRNLKLGTVQTNEKHWRSWRVDLPNGLYTYHVEATDEAGNRFLFFGQERYFTVR